MFKQKMLLNDKQMEIIDWIKNHPCETALKSWEMLFGERNSKEPDVCINYYDSLDARQKSDIELVVARYYSLKNNGKNKKFNKLLFSE